MLKIVFFRRKKRTLRVAEIKLCFSGLRLSWLLLAGKRPRGYLQVFVTLNPQSTCHGPRPGPTHAPQCYTRASCVPRNREHEKRPAAGRQKNADVQEKDRLAHSNLYCQHTPVYCNVNLTTESLLVYHTIMFNLACVQKMRHVSTTAVMPL